MALWTKVQQLMSTLTGEALRQVHSIYDTQFPIEVRHCFADWIEGQPWDRIEEDNAQHEAYAATLLEQLVQKLDEMADDIDMQDKFLLKIKLQQTAQRFRDNYGNNPMKLVRVVKNVLHAENERVTKAVSTRLGFLQETQCTQIQQQFEDLTACTQGTERDLKSMQQKQESFIIQYQDSVKINGQLQQLTSRPNGQYSIEVQQTLQQRKQQTDFELRVKAQEVQELRKVFADKLSRTLDTIEKLQQQILDNYLFKWKCQQQAAMNGAPFEDTLDILAHWCENLAEIIWNNRQQIRKVDRLRLQLPMEDQHNPQAQLNKTITDLLTKLVTTGFVVEKQPPQVLKKESKFTATVRLLVGSKLNVHMNPPNVKATIISDDQANDLLHKGKPICSGIGNVLNSSCTMEYHQATGHLAVAFRNMQVKTFRRPEKKGNETQAVTEEKACLLFQSDFTVGNDQELLFKVWTISLPVVVTVHGNQECNAAATVLWDNAFAQPGRVPFDVPDEVPWPLLAETLSHNFCRFAGRGLSPSNLNYIAYKLFGPAEDYSEKKATWALFNKEPLQGRNFTIWEWFFNVRKLTKDWLSASWKDGLIYGFISKQEASERLNNRPSGTFLLRFSDAVLGGISLAWISEDAQNPGGERKVWNLEPFTAKDFAIRKLADRLKDLNELHFLYPDIPKATGFAKYWSVLPEIPVTASDGYIAGALRMEVKKPGQPAGVGMCASPLHPSLAASPMSQVPSPMHVAPAGGMHSMHSPPIYPGAASPPMYDQSQSGMTPNMVNMQQSFPAVDHLNDMEFSILDMDQDISQVNVSEIMGMQPNPPMT